MSTGRPFHQIWGHSNVRGSIWGRHVRTTAPSRGQRHHDPSRVTTRKNRSTQPGWFRLVTKKGVRAVCVSRDAEI